MGYTDDWLDDDDKIEQERKRYEFELEYSQMARPAKMVAERPAGPPAPYLLNFQTMGLEPVYNPTYQRKTYYVTPNGEAVDVTGMMKLVETGVPEMKLVEKEDGTKAYEVTVKARMDPEKVAQMIQDHIQKVTKL